MWLRPRATVSTSSHFSAPRRFYPKKSFLSKRFFVPQMPSLLNTKTYFGSRCTTRTRIVPDFRRSYSLNYSTSSVHQIDPSVHSLQQLTTMGLLEEAESELASIPPSNRTADHYNPIMEYHVRAGNATRARALLKEMKSLKIPPNEASYNLALEVTAWSLSVKEAEEIYAEMVALGVKPSELALNSLVEMFQQKGNNERAAHYQAIMEQLYPSTD